MAYLNAEPQPMPIHTRQSFFMAALVRSTNLKVFASNAKHIRSDAYSSRAEAVSRVTRIRLFND